MTRVRICAELGCYATALVGSNRCETHPKKGGNSAPYQGERHKAWARAVLLRDKTCRHPGCTAPSEHADHVVPIADNPALRFVLSNGQGLCQPHHSAKTMGELRFRQRLSAI